MNSDLRQAYFYMFLGITVGIPTVFGPFLFGPIHDPDNQFLMTFFAAYAGCMWTCGWLIRLYIKHEEEQNSK
jgi:hypothetical protein